MQDTGFSVRPEQSDRLAASYIAAEEGGIRVGDDPRTSSYLQQPGLLSGGGGLVSTAGDYLRFSRMLLDGGRLDGARIIGRKTLELMTQNHIVGDKTIGEASASGYLRSELTRAAALALASRSGWMARKGNSRARRGVQLVRRGGHALLDRPAEELAAVLMIQVHVAFGSHALQPAPRGRSIVCIAPSIRGTRAIAGKSPGQSIGPEA